MTKSKNIVAFSSIYGVLLAVALIAAELLFYFTGKLEKGESWYLYIFYLLFPIYIGYCCYLYRNNKGFLKIENGLAIGLLVGLVSTIVYQTFSFILAEVIDPTLYDRIIENVDYTGYDLSEEEMNDAKEMIQSDAMMTMSKIVARVTHFGSSLFFGLIYGLIGGLIFKKNEPILED